ncbi:transposase [Mucispirillum schaedleri ASF457]|uniref:IS3 family transposase ISEnfa3 n=1 Tax=Mucispirillum schaedleri ASF457 TaxID=1379858 RepID=A0AA97LQT0_9BACT|nr:IS3 family transposase [Mucispirillum schaedleri]USF24917.1 IS3 family transposase ISEnfa3 [Mucispirillum schaedleri ASF457]SIW07566.1 transposase [Mucispirillum schaedleri ASF457]
MARKYSYEFKKYLVTVLENGIMSVSELSRCCKIHKGVICNIYNRYKHSGESRLHHIFTRNEYSRAFKLNVLTYKASNNLSYEQTALHFNIPSASVIYDWHNFCCNYNGDNMSYKSPNNKHLHFVKDINNQAEVCEEYKSMKARIAELEKELYYSLDILLSVSNMKRSTYYYNVKKPAALDKYAEVKASILEIYEKPNKTYGYPRITKVLEKLGYTYDRKTVYKLMKELKISSLIRVKKRYKQGRVSHICSNKLNRAFTSERPCLKWVTDVAEIKINNEKVYLSAIMDLYNREITAYSVSKYNNEDMVIDSLKQAIDKTKDTTGLMIHSDQGILYQANEFRNLLKSYNIERSMSRRGNCYDNAVMESFFAVLKCEFVYINKFKNIEQFKYELEKYIDFYNNYRIKANGLTPLQEKEIYLVA